MKSDKLAEILYDEIKAVSNLALRSTLYLSYKRLEGSTLPEPIKSGRRAEILAAAMAAKPELTKTSNVGQHSRNVWNIEHWVHSARDSVLGQTIVALGITIQINNLIVKHNRKRRREIRRDKQHELDNLRREFTLREARIQMIYRRELRALSERNFKNSEIKE